MDEFIYYRYRVIACLAIIQGINDFLQGRDNVKELRNWIEESDLFDLLNLDREWFYAKALELKRRGIRKIRRGLYGIDENRLRQLQSKTDDKD